MARGIIYVMSTAVPGLVKIGKTSSYQFKSRMYNLESNGYRNITSLKCRFAIEVDEYDKKEILLDEIFSKSRVSNTELFALDIDLVIELLSSFDGKKIFPEELTKEEVFEEAEEKRGCDKVPYGTYTLEKNRKGFGLVKAKMRVEDGKFVLEKGSICAPLSKSSKPSRLRNQASIKDNILLEDVVCSSPSTAADIALGTSNDGWKVWKDRDGDSIDLYRQGKKNGLKQQFCQVSLYKTVLSRQPILLTVMSGQPYPRNSLVKSTLTF